MSDDKPINFPPNMGSIMADALRDLPDEMDIPVPMPAEHMRKGLGEAGSPLIVKGMDKKLYRYKIASIKEVDAKNCEIKLKKEPMV